MMSFRFDFDVHAQNCGPNDADESNLSDVKSGHAAQHTKGSGSPAEPVQKAAEHFPPPDPHPLLVDAVSETVAVGSLPALHFLNETVFEKTALEREDGENILSRTADQRSDLISGVYEGGLKVWECTYDLLEWLERGRESFEGKGVLDLGCGAGLLGILALKRNAMRVHFQDYNSTVIKQLTLPNVLLNSQEGDTDGGSDDDDEDDDEGEGNEERQIKDGDKNEKDEKKQDLKDGHSAVKKRAVDPSQSSLLARCRFFSGDWTTFLALVLKDDPSTKYDIIFTSETIYNTAYYPSLHKALQKLLAPDGLVYLATKAHYFGVGGGLHLFEKFVEQQGVFFLDHMWDGEEGLQRHVVGLRFKIEKDKT